MKANHGYDPKGTQQCRLCKLGGHNALTCPAPKDLLDFDEVIYTDEAMQAEVQPVAVPAATESGSGNAGKRPSSRAHVAISKKAAKEASVQLNGLLATMRGGAAMLASQAVQEAALLAATGGIADDSMLDAQWM